MKWILAVLCLWLALPAVAAPGDVRRFPAKGPDATRLVVHGSTDLDVIAAVITDFQRLHPDVEVVYEDITSQDLYARYIAAPRRPGGPDLMISSGMDLQTRLANDGHLLPHVSPRTTALPAWAHWRHEVIGISYEPVVIAYNRKVLPQARVPRTRRQLIDLLRSGRPDLQGRVGTYDVTRSSVGYLIATQDAEAGSIAGPVVDALGDNGVVRDTLVATLLDRLERGEIALAYNVLGSYVQARIDAGAPLGIVMPEDYTLVLLRTAVIPRTAAHPEQARRFLDYLLSPRGQHLLSQEARLLPTVPGGIAADLGGRPEAFRPIRLGPGLLVYLDAMKRRQFLDAWRRNADVDEQLP